MNDVSLFHFVLPPFLNQPGLVISLRVFFLYLFWKTRKNLWDSGTGFLPGVDDLPVASSFLLHHWTLEGRGVASFKASLQRQYSAFFVNIRLNIFIDLDSQELRL